MKATSIISRRCKVMNFELTPEEAKILYEYLKYEYVSYENLQLLELVRRLRKYITEMEDSGDLPHC